MLIAFLIASSLLVLLLVVSNLNNNKSLSISSQLENTNLMMKVLEEQKVLLAQFQKVIDQNLKSAQLQERLESLKLQKDRINKELKTSSHEVVAVGDDLIELTSNNEVLLNTLQATVVKGLKSTLLDVNNLELMIQKSTQATVLIEGKGRSMLRNLEQQQKQLVTKSILMNRVYTFVGLLLLAVMFVLIQRDFNRGKSERLQLKRSNIRLINEVSKKSQELVEVIEKIHEGYFIFNKAGECTYCNTQGATMLGISYQEIQSKSFQDIFSSWFDDTFNSTLLSSIRSGGSIVHELRIPGGLKYFIFSMYGTADGHVAIFRDISEIRRAQEEVYRSNEKLLVLNEQLRELSTYLQRVREDERDYISKEIHDHFGQLLTSLKLDLSWMENNVQVEMKDRVKDAIELLNEAIQSVRRISADLRPAILDDFGFVAALEWHIKNFHQKTGIEIQLDLGNGKYDFNRELSTALFRIVQESMTNTFRHARATKMNIQMATTGDIFQMIIQDNGIGMAMDKKSGGIGLIGMKERALALGGNLEIITAANEGTTLIFTLEVKNEMYRY